MYLRKSLFSTTGRGVVLAALAASALTTIEPSFAFAGSSAPATKGLAATSGTSTATDFSAVRRRYHGGGGAAAAAAFAGIVGTGLAIAATQNRRDYYYDEAPGYYGGPYASYGYAPGYGYAPRYHAPGYGYSDWNASARGSY